MIQTLVLPRRIDISSLCKQTKSFNAWNELLWKSRACPMKRICAHKMHSNEIIKCVERNVLGCQAVMAIIDFLYASGYCKTAAAIFLEYLQRR